MSKTLGKPCDPTKCWVLSCGHPIFGKPDWFHVDITDPVCGFSVFIAWHHLWHRSNGGTGHETDIGLAAQASLTHAAQTHHDDRSVKPIVLGIIKLMETTIAVKAIRFYVYLCLSMSIHRRRLKHSAWKNKRIDSALLYCKMVHFPSSDLHLLHGKPLFRGQIRLQRWKLSWKARWNHQLDNN